MTEVPDDLLERMDRAGVVTGVLTPGLRGDGIRLWETHDSLVQGNRVTGSRDGFQQCVWERKEPRGSRQTACGPHRSQRQPQAPTSS